MARMTRKNNVVNMPGTEAAGGSAPQSSNRPADPDAVAIRAYDIYQSRGGRHGADLDDWLQAERELIAQTPAQARPRRGAASKAFRPKE